MTRLRSAIRFDALRAPARQARAHLLSELGRFRQSSLVRNAQWMFLGQGLGYLSQAAYFIVVAKLVGSTQYGAYAGAFAFVTLLAQYSTLGSQSLFLRYVCPNRSLVGLYWGNILMATLGLGTVFVIALTLLGPHLAKSYSVPLISCVAMSECLCRQLTIASGGVFQAFEKLQVTAALNLVTNLLRLFAVSVMLVWLRAASAFQLAVAILFVSCFAAVAAIALVTRHYGKPIFSPRLLAARAREGFLYSISYSTASIYNDIDKTMLSHYGMLTANGIYTMAYRFVDVSTTPIGSIQAAAFPRFFQHGAKGIAHTEVFAKKILTRTALLGLAVALLLFATAPLIPVFLGKGFAQSAQALRWLCILPFFRSFHSSGGDALSGAGYAHFRVISQAFAALFNFSVNLYLIPHYSWLGAAWSSLITDGLLGVTNWGFVLLLRNHEGTPAGRDMRLGKVCLAEGPE